MRQFFYNIRYTIVSRCNARNKYNTVTTTLFTDATVKHLMFAWDLFCEFRDRLKIAKFNTRKLEKKCFHLNKKTPLHVPPLLSILALVNVSGDC